MRAQWVVAILIAALVVALAIRVGLLVQADDPDEAAVGATGPAQEATPSLRPSDGTWHEAWRLPLPGGGASRGDHDASAVLTNGAVLIVQGPGGGSSTGEGDVVGYDLTGATPSKTWTIWNPGSRPLALAEEAIIFTDSIADASTGAVVRAPWEGQRPELIMAGLVITCADDSATCSAWDLEGTSATLRWTQDLPGTRTPGFDEKAIAGGTASGYAKITLSEKSQGLPMVAFVSLVDGSVHGTQGQTDEKGRLEPITPAADGWLRQSNDLGRMTALALDGSPSGPSPRAASHSYSLLRSRSGMPTVEQYRSAWEAGDASWAATALQCSFSPGTDGISCTLDGRSLRVPFGTKSTALGGMTAREDVSDRFVNDRWIIMGQQDPSLLAEVRIIDRHNRRVIAGPPALYGQDAKVAVARPDLLIAVEGGSLVAYAPRI